MPHQAGEQVEQPRTDSVRCECGRDVPVYVGDLIDRADQATQQLREAEARAERLSADLKEANRRDKHGQRKRAEAAEQQSAELRERVEAVYLALEAFAVDKWGGTNPILVLDDEKPLRDAYMKACPYAPSVMIRKLAALSPKGNDDG